MARTTTILLVLLLLLATQAQSQPIPASSEKVRSNPAAQYLLVKTVVGKSLGAVDARAEPIEPEGYNLLKYCWTPVNVLGAWAKPAELAGQLVVRALETLSWQRDLVRAGYPAEPVALAIGHYEATVLSAGLTEAARTLALEALTAELDGLKHRSPGAAEVRAVPRCQGELKSIALNYKLVPDDGRVRFVPYVLHQVCQAQELDPNDPVRCDYWLDGRKDEPMAFAGATVFSARWADGTVAGGRFDPEALRSDGVVTLRRPAVKAKQ
jgi:hypothetical protein